MTSILALICGFILDLLVGDPYWMPHPIRAIGWMIQKGEGLVRQMFGEEPKQLKIAGGVLTAGVTLSTLAVAMGILNLARVIHPAVGFVVESVMYYQILATKCLKVESMKVHDALAKHDLEDARYKVSMIVGRDTQSLDEAGVAKAAIETVAENTSDGVIAPLFFCMLGGAPLGLWYKAVNTLDSMIGYKNDKYYDLGYVAANLDDIANFIPARLAAYLMIGASKLLGLDAKGAYKIFKRDRFNHKSPNSAQTEAVCAGALGIQLAGDAYYFGQLLPKQTIGDAHRPVTHGMIKDANRLLYSTAMLALLGAVLYRMIIVLV